MTTGKSSRLEIVLERPLNSLEKSLYNFTIKMQEITNTVGASSSLLASISSLIIYFINEIILTVPDWRLGCRKQKENRNFSLLDIEMLRFKSFLCQ